MSAYSPSRDQLTRPPLEAIGVTFVTRPRGEWTDKDLDQLGHSDDRRIEPSCMRHGNEAKQCRNDQWLDSHAVSFVHSRQRRDRRRRMPGAQEAALRTGLPQVCQCGCGPPRPGSQAGQEVGLAGFWVHAFDQDRFVPTAMPPSAAARLERPLVRRAPSKPIPGESGQDEAQCYLRSSR